MKMARPRDLLRHLHWPVLIPAGILMLLGVLALSGLAIRIPGAGIIDDWGTRQLRWLALGLAASSNATRCASGRSAARWRRVASRRA